MKKENIKPLGENILVEVVKESNKTESGIVLPEDTNQEKPQKGKVIAIGESEKIRVKKNQKVIFTKYAGTEIKINKQALLILKNEDILATIE